MLFAIMTTDCAGSAEKRAFHHEAHYAHMMGAETQGVTIVLAGPLLQDDEKTPMGSLIIVEAAGRSIVGAFWQRDPFFLQGVWQTVVVYPFLGRSA